MLEAGFSELRAGRLFLWNPYQLCGIPGVATGVAGFLYPLNLLHLAVPTVVAMEILTVFHLILAGIFTTSAARSFGISWAGATVAAFAYSLTYPLSNFYFPNSVAALAWFPLGIAAIERIVAHKNRRWYPVLAIAAAMPWLASAPQTATYTWLALGLCALCALIRDAVRSRSTTGTIVEGARLTVTMVAAALLAAPQILPTLELAAVSARAGEALPVAAYTPWGRPSLVHIFQTAVVPPAQFRIGFVGAIPLLLACAAIGVRLQGAHLLCAIFLLWGTIGTYSPDWYIRGMHALPLVGSFRVPGRMAFVAALAIALLAGLGTDALAGALKLGRRRVWTAGILVLGSFGLSYVRFPHEAYWVPLFLVPVAAAVCLPKARWKSVFVIATSLVLVVFDLVGFTKNTAMIPYANNQWREIHKYATAFTELRERAGLNRVVLGGASNMRRDWALKSAMLERFYTVQDHEPLSFKAFADFFAYGALGRPASNTPKDVWLGYLPREYLLAPSEPFRRFLRLLSVRYLAADNLSFLDSRFANFAGELEVVTLKSSNNGAKPLPFRVLEDSHALPRAYAAYNAECISDFATTLQRLRQPDFNPDTSVVLDNGCESMVIDSWRPPLVTISTYTPMRVEIAASVDYPAWLVLTDTHYPGWQAFVNGQREPIRRANGVVRAVRLPAGDSHVEFRYVPWSFYAGVISAIVAILSWATWALCRRRVSSSQSITP